MPQVADGANVTISIPDNTLLSLVVNGGAVRYENPVGTIVYEGGYDRSFGPLPTGSIKLTSVQGSFQYEVSNDSTKGIPRNIVIFAAGDSHTNGQIPTSVSGSETLGAYAFTSPRDKQWNGTGVNAYFKADSQINSQSTPTQSTDPACAVGAGVASFVNDIPRLLRDGYPTSVGDVTIANLGAGGASAYTWAGELAYGHVSGLLAPTDGDTVTIGGQVYTFRTSPSVAYDVLIGTATGSILNLSNAVNAESTGWGAGTVANPNVFCPVPSATTNGRFHAKATGTAGNSIVIASSNTTRVTAVTPAFTPIASQAMTLGSATSALYSNGKSKVAGLWPSVVMYTLGTNCANRPGYRGVGTQAELTKIVARHKLDYPGVPIIFWRPPVVVPALAAAAMNATVIPAIDAVVAADPTIVFSYDMNSIPIGSGNVLMIRSDGIHCTGYGYSVASQLAAKAVAQVLGLS